MTLLKKLENLIPSTSSFWSFLLSCLSFGVEALADIKFSCPCRSEWNEELFLLFLFAPACFAFVLMFLFLRPFKDKCKPGRDPNSPQPVPTDPPQSDQTNQQQSDQTNQQQSDQTNQQQLDKTHCLKQFVRCLVPPVVWIFLVLYDGDYYACSKTDWSGTYVTDDELKMKWCKPTNSSERDLQLRDRTQSLRVWSETRSYIVAIAFCTGTFLIVCVFDLCGCGNSQQDKANEDIEMEQLPG